MNKQNNIQNVNLASASKNKFELEIPNQIIECKEADIRRAIDVFSRQFGNPRISSSGSLFYNNGTGAAELKQKDSIIYPRLRMDSLNLPRETQLRLLAHEIEHARHR